MAKTKQVRRTKKASSGVSAIRIPSVDEVNEPSTTLTDYAICLFGEKGVGKTSLAAQFENSLIIMLEPKRRNLRIRQVNVDPMSIRDMEESNPKMTPWMLIKEYTKAVLADDTVDTVGIDTVDRAWEACINHHCFQKGIKDPSDANDHGRTWRVIKDDFEQTMNKLLYADKGLIFISHAHLREVESHEGDNQWVPTCAPAAWKYLKAVCDLAIHFGYTESRRALTIRNPGRIWSSCGPTDQFRTADGTPIETFFSGNSHEESYKILTDAFNNEIDESLIASTSTIV
jgi:hypothetical protein